MPTIPETQFRRLLETRGIFEDNLDESMDGLSAEITLLAKKAIRKIKDSNYKPSVVRREAKKLTSKANRGTRDTTADSVAKAALLGIAAGSIVRAWDVSARSGRAYSTKAIVREAQTIPKRPPPSNSTNALNTNGVTPGKIPRIPKVPEIIPGVDPRVKPASTPYRKTDGVVQLQKDIARGNIRPNRNLTLSERLHTKGINNTKTVDNAMSKILREGKAMDDAGRVLIREARKQGANIGAGELPRYLQRLKRAGRNLTKLGSDDPAALKEWNKAFNSVKTQVGKLADSRGGGAELIQLLENGRVDRMDKALTRWLDEKQRFNAERIVDSTSSATYRQNEYNQAKKQKRITSFIWHLNRPARRKYVRRVKRRKKGKLKGRRCVCEGLDGKTFPIEVAKDYPMGGHPFCKCTFEYIYNTGETVKVTGEEIAWFEGLPDGPAPATQERPRRAPQRATPPSRVSRPASRPTRREIPASAERKEAFSGALEAKQMGRIKQKAVRSKKEATPSKKPSPKTQVSAQPPVSGFDRNALADALDSKLGPKQQKEIRTQLNAILNEEGLVSHDNLYKRTFRLKYDTMANSAPAHGLHHWDGEITLTHNRHLAAIRALRGSVAKKNLAGVRTLVHESIHGTAPIIKGAYAEGALVLEEATTEMLARDIIIKRFKGVSWKDLAGSYDDWVETLEKKFAKAWKSSTGKAIGREKARTLLVDVSRKMRSTERIKAISTPQEYKDYFLSVSGDVVKGAGADGSAFVSALEGAI